MLNYGMAISASGVLTSMARMDLHSNNLANVNTTAFSPQSIGVRARDVVREEDNLGYMESNELIERLGAGVMPTATRISESQGPIEETGNPLDVAIEGKGMLMVDNGSSNQPVSLTRDGRMTLANDGRLVHTPSGRAILDRSGKEIFLDPNQSVRIRDDGAIIQGAGPVAQLGYVQVDDVSTLVKQGESLLRPTRAQLDNAVAGTGRIRSQSLEKSGVNPVNTMMSVTRAGGNARSGLRMISTLDSVLDAAINRLGRVS